jgi:tetratricopeptide (TPR) repeat protein
MASDTAAARVLCALRARDRLAEAMVSAGGSLEGEALSRIIALDERLKSCAVVLEGAVGSEVLAGWRETLRPPPEAWWWSLDERAAVSVWERGLGWQLGGGFLVLVSICLSADISQRFLRGGPDFESVFTTLSQALLALLVGSTFTGVENTWLDRVFSRRAVRLGRRPLWKLGLALAVFGLVLALKLSLPAIAGRYDRRGAELFEQERNYPAALQQFQRALALHPSFAEAHFHLAVAFEELHDDEQAIDAYEAAIREYTSEGASDKLPLLYNNLARLHLRRQAYGEALQLLEEAFQKHQQGVGDADFAYAIHKNRGWARLGLELYHHARVDLMRALELQPDATGAHCLLAQVYAKQENKDEAFSHWEACLVNHDPKGEPVEAVWIDTARERVAVELKGQP